MSIEKITFEGVLNWLATKAGTRWNMVFQASQFDSQEFSDQLNFGQLTLNLSPNATRDMELFEDYIYFKIRKHGIVQEMTIPYTALMIIQDPDDPADSMAWPFFLDHGDDFVQEPMTAEEYAISRMAELGVTITPEQMKEHAAAMHELSPDLFDKDGNLDVFALSAKAKRRSDTVEPVADDELKSFNFRTPTFDQLMAGFKFPGDSASNDTVVNHGKTGSLAERMEKSNMTVIEGGKSKVIATLPWIDEVYRAKRAAREAKQVAGRNVETQAEAIRSDGSKGNSAFFPGLDVTKCHFPVKRIERPSWLKVVDGGKA